MKTAFSVAQTSSLLCRGFPIRKRHGWLRPCRLEVGDTAGWKPALRHITKAPLERRPTKSVPVGRRSSGASPAFTLIEVMIATTIFFMSMFAILGVLSAGIHAATVLRSGSGPTAGMVAGYFCVSNKIEEGPVQGDFADIAGYEGYNWRSDAVEVTNGLYRMDFAVIDPSGKPSSVLVNMYLYKPGGGSGNKLGLQPPPQPR